MAALEFRPKTNFTYAGDVKNITDRILAQTRRNNPARLNATVGTDRIVLSFPKGSSEIWTPQLELFLSPREQGGVDVSGIIGPRSSIWRMFHATLIFVVGMGVIGLIMGFVQWTVKLPPWGFYLAVAGLCAGLFVWFLSEEGKRRAHDEINLLRTFMDDALDTDHFLGQGSGSTQVFHGRVA